MHLAILKMLLKKGKSLTWVEVSTKVFPNSANVVTPNGVVNEATNILPRKRV